MLKKQIAFLDDIQSTGGSSDIKTYMSYGTLDQYNGNYWMHGYSFTPVFCLMVTGGVSIPSTCEIYFAARPCRSVITAVIETEYMGVYGTTGDSDVTWTTNGITTIFHAPAGGSRYTYFELILGV